MWNTTCAPESKTTKFLQGVCHYCILLECNMEPYLKIYSLMRLEKKWIIWSIAFYSWPLLHFQVFKHNGTHLFKIIIWYDYLYMWSKTQTIFHLFVKITILCSISFSQISLLSFYDTLLHLFSNQNQEIWERKPFPLREEHLMNWAVSVESSERP